MRLVSSVLIAGVATALAASSALGQRPDDQILPRSEELLKQGEAHLAAGKFVEADEAFETALAVDPRNRAAYNALAKVAQREKLYGQSIRYTKKALMAEPKICGFSGSFKALALLGVLLGSAASCATAAVVTASAIAAAANRALLGEKTNPADTCNIPLLFRRIDRVSV